MNIKGEEENNIEKKTLANLKFNSFQYGYDYISRLKQEESRHEESQANESKRIQSQINFLKENNEQLSEVLNEFLARVVHLEHALGPNK